MQKTKIITTEEEINNTTEDYFIVKYESDAFDELTYSFKTIKDEIIDQRRWRNLHELVVQRESDGTFFEYTIEIGSNENCDGGEDDIEVTRVYPRMVLKKVYDYEPFKNGLQEYFFKAKEEACENDIIEGDEFYFEKGYEAAMKMHGGESNG